MQGSDPTELFLDGDSGPELLLVSVEETSEWCNSKVLLQDDLLARTRSGLRTLFADPELSLLWLAAPGIMIRRQIQAMF